MFFLQVQVHLLHFPAPSILLAVLLGAPILVEPDCRVHMAEFLLGWQVAGLHVPLTAVLEFDISLRQPHMGSASAPAARVSVPNLSPLSISTLRSVLLFGLVTPNLGMCVPCPFLSFCLFE